MPFNNDTTDKATDNSYNSAQTILYTFKKETPNTYIEAKIDYKKSTSNTIINKKEKCLILLDLDGTVIHTEDNHNITIQTICEELNFICFVLSDEEKNNYLYTLYPAAIQFIMLLKDYGFNVKFYSLGIKDRNEAVVEFINSVLDERYKFNIEEDIYSREDSVHFSSLNKDIDCYYKSFNRVITKEKQLGYEYKIENILLIDDSPNCITSKYSKNLIPVISYDNLLETLLKIKQEKLTVENNPLIQNNTKDYREYKETFLSVNHFYSLANVIDSIVKKSNNSDQNLNDIAYDMYLYGSKENNFSRYYLRPKNYIKGLKLLSQYKIPEIEKLGYYMSDLYCKEWIEQAQEHAQSQENKNNKPRNNSF